MKTIWLIIELIFIIILKTMFDDILDQTYDESTIIGYNSLQHLFATTCDFIWFAIATVIIPIFYSTQMVAKCVCTRTLWEIKAMFSICQIFCSCCNWLNHIRNDTFNRLLIIFFSDTMLNHFLENVFLITQLKKNMSKTNSYPKIKIYSSKR